MNTTVFRRMCPVASFALILGVLGASADGQTSRARGIDLIYQWIEGESTRYRVQEDMVQEVSGEFSTTLHWQREFTYTERVIEADKETGIATIERVIDSVSIEVEGDGIEPARYDSKDPRTDNARSNPMIAPFANMNGQTIRFTIDGQGQVTSVEGAVDLWSAALEGFSDSPLGGALEDASPSNESMRRQIEAGLHLIPGRAVRIRDSWTQRLPHATPIGTLTSEMEHTLRGFKRTRSGRHAKIETRGTLTMGDSSAGSSGLPGVLRALAGVEITLGESSIKGETLFDVKNGRLVRQEMTVTTKWTTNVTGLKELSGEGHQQMTQRSVLERID